MMTGMNTPILAVDGGGTNCRIACCAGGQRHVVGVGPANVASDFEGAVARIVAGLEQLAGQLQQPLRTLCRQPAYLGLAGVTGPQMAARVAEALPLELLRVEDDRRSALVGAHAGGDGAIAHCGTGSFLALQRQGAQRFAGGWGSVLGDEASAQWVGRKALSVALDVVDGLTDSTNLTETLLREFDGPAGVVAFAGQARPYEVGQVARKVTAAAEVGDAVGVALMREAAMQLLQVLERMGWTPELPLCLTGGIGPQYQPYLPEAARAALVAPQGAPLEGAITLAQSFAAEVQS